MNKPLNFLRTQTSDPKLAGYALAAKQVATEYERMLTGGMLSAAQLHTGAAEDAKSILNENMSVAEVEAVIPVMTREMNNALQAGNEEEQRIKEGMKSPVARSVPGPTIDQTGKASNTPKVGEKRTINGTPAHWDGKGWLAD